MITTSSFTPDAVRYASGIGKRVILIDGMTLVHYMIDHGLGVRTAQSYHVPAIDLDYFEGNA